VKEVISVGVLPPILGDMDSLKSALMRAETEKFVTLLKEEANEY
jgi:thiamine pyrophosphokinase